MKNPPSNSGASRFISGPLRLFQFFLVLLSLLFLVAPWFPAEWFVVRDNTGALFKIDRGHGNWMPMNLLWGMLGWFKIHWSIRALLPAIIALLCFLPENKNSQPPRQNIIPMTTWRFWCAAIFGLVFGAFFAVFHVHPAIKEPLINKGSK